MKIINLIFFLFLISLNTFILVADSSFSNEYKLRVIASDADQDGISDEDEKIIGTNPLISNIFVNLTSDDDIHIKNDGSMIPFISKYFYEVSSGDKKNINFKISINDSYKDKISFIDIKSTSPFLSFKINKNNIHCDIIINKPKMKSHAFIIFKVNNSNNFIKLLLNFEFDAKIITNPISKININSLPMAIAQKDNIAYIADFNNAQLKLYDISNPKNIHYLKSMSIGHGTITDIFIDNQRMYISQGSEGVAVLDITNPSNPIVLKTNETGREYWDIFGQSLNDRGYKIGEEYVYAVDNKAGKVDIFDTNLNIVKTIDITPSQRDIRVYVENNFDFYSGKIIKRYLFITSEEHGLVVYCFKGNGFDNMDKIYENSDLELSGISAVNSLISITSNNITHIFNSVYTGPNPHEFILFGLKTDKLKINGIENSVDIEEIKDDGQSINTSGYVSNNYNQLVGGNYKFNFIKEDELDLTLNTQCYGPFVIDGNNLVCANKNNQSLEIYPIKGEKKFLILNKGWSIEALPINVKSSPNIFDTSYIVWKWDNSKQTWSVYSPKDEIKDKLKHTNIDTISTINPGEGFWIYNSEACVKVLSGDSYGIEKLNIKDGWNLLGTGKDIQIDDLKDKEARVVWQYNDGSWKLWGKDIDDSFYDRFNKINTIKANQGFWLLK